MEKSFLFYFFGVRISNYSLCLIFIIEYESYLSPHPVCVEWTLNNNYNLKSRVSKHNQKNICLEFIYYIFNAWIINVFDLIIGFVNTQFFTYLFLLLQFFQRKEFVAFDSCRMNFLKVDCYARKNGCCAWTDIAKASCGILREWDILANYSGMLRNRYYINICSSRRFVLFG